MDQTQAASSTAEVDVFQGQSPTMAEYDHYRLTGELSERFKPAEKAATDTLEETAVEPAGDEPEPESDPDEEVEAQEPPQKGSPAQKRILQLLAENKRLKEAAAAKTDVKPESSTAQAEPTPQATRPKPTVDAKDKDGKPKYASYEDYIEDLADWKAEQQLARFKAEQAKQEALKSTQAKLDEARARYKDADEVIFPAAQAINDAKIPPVIKQVFADSDVFADLCYVVGSDADELTKFVSLAQTNPRAALAKVFEYERAIREELSSEGKEETKAEKAPEVKKTTAPKPPVPVGGGSSKAFDVNDESLSADEWRKKREKQLSQRRG